MPSLRATGCSASPSVLPAKRCASALALSPASGAKAADVDEPDDLAGVGGDVGDHRAAVGMPDQQHRPIHAAHDVADGGGVAGEPPQRIGGSDHVVTRLEQVMNDAIPARGLGKRAMDENDRGRHD